MIIEIAVFVLTLALGVYLAYRQYSLEKIKNFQRLLLEVSKSVISVEQVFQKTIELQTLSKEEKSKQKKLMAMEIITLYATTFGIKLSDNDVRVLEYAVEAAVFHLR